MSDPASISARMEQMIADKVRKDPVVRRFESEIRYKEGKIRELKEKTILAMRRDIAVVRAAIRYRREQIKKEVEAQLRKELGVRSIPSTKPVPASIKAWRDRMAADKAAALQALQPPAPPAPPA